MKAEPGDRLDDGASGSGFPLRSLLIALALLLLLALGWWWTQQDEPMPIEPEGAVTEPQAAPAQPLLPPTPDIPERPEPEPEPEQADALPEPAPLPPLALADSDPEIRQTVRSLSDDNLFVPMMRSDNLVQRGVAVIDGFSRGSILNKVLPLTASRTPAFVAEIDGERMTMGAANYVRFDDFVGVITALDVNTMVESFHRYRPLFEQAYGELGYPQSDFDNALIHAIDIVLATPEIPGDIELERKKVTYSYADPALEGLPDLQKQLLRLGPENTRKIKEWAQGLRDALLR